MFATNRKLKITCSIILIALISIYGVVYILSSMYLKSTNLREIIINQAEQRLGRKVNMDDDLVFTIDWNMSPHVTVNHLLVSNLEGSKHPLMLSVDKVSLNFSLIKLIFKEFHVISLDFVNPVLYLESNTGKNNWDFVNKDPDPNRTIKVSIHDISVKDGSVSLQEDNKPEQKLSIEQLDFRGNVETMECAVRFTGEYNRLPVQTSFTVEIGEKSTHIDLSKFTSDNSDLTGTITIEHNPIKINGSLQSNHLDLTGLLHKASSNTNPSGEYSLPTTPIPVTDLRNGDVVFKIDIKQLVLGKISFKNFHLKASDKDNIINIKLDPPAEVANGTVNLDLSYNLNPDTPTLSFNLKTNKLKLEQVLEASGSRSPLSGSDLSFRINLNSTGNNLNSLVANANGQILAQLGPGQFLNSTGFSNPFSNVLSSMITFNKKESTTGFNCGVLNLRVNNGVGNGNNNVGVEAASVKVLGNGMIDLRNGRIKFSMTPTSILSTNFDINQFNMAQMIQVSGTVSNPQVSLNPISIGGAVVSAAKIAGLATGLPGIAMLAGAELNGSNSSNQITPCKTALSN